MFGHMICGGYSLKFSPEKYSRPFFYGRYLQFLKWPLILLNTSTCFPKMTVTTIEHMPAILHILSPLTSIEHDRTMFLPHAKQIHPKLVGGGYLPLWKMMEWKSVGKMKFPYMKWKITHLWNHQPVIIPVIMYGIYANIWVYSSTVTGWCPPVISWFINPNN